ncbi:MAG: response regulator transcription factor [Oscillospiraceae bacterium]|nr:response regulator transcription factor [Oscillospiraceae bacterium]
MGKRVLVVDDESNIVDILKFNLEREGYEVICAYDGGEALEKARSEAPDLILLDVMLPVMDGFGVLGEIRKNDKLTPVIMLTAREEERDKVLGLEIGADDYIVKPFSVRELMARVKTNIRRMAVMEPAEELTKNTAGAEGLVLDKDRMCVIKPGGEVVELTQREYDIIKFMSTEKGKIYSREELMSGVWNYDYYGDLRAVDVAVRRLREKLEDDPANPKYIITKRGAGYYLAE